MGVDMSAITATGIQETIQSVFRGKAVKRVELFGSAARGETTSDSDVDILVTPAPDRTSS
jgi:predicted nucleotidyltransferase